ncbi:hypothetical protein [Nakamurella lactea]|uniref:hypothetical protein n=1 Tax=Nakamurella lactea TaxID=459515 RepID=UPI001FE11133|nr:hypothetical protein [Nakamurella lactea]
MTDRDGTEWLMRIDRQDTGLRIDRVRLNRSAGCQTAEQVGADPGIPPGQLLDRVLIRVHLLGTQVVKQPTQPLQALARVRNVDALTGQESVIDDAFQRADPVNSLRRRETLKGGSRTAIPAGALLAHQFVISAEGDRASSHDLPGDLERFP